MQLPRALIRIGTCFEYTKIDKVTPNMEREVSVWSRKNMQLLNIVKSWQNSLNCLCSI